MSRGRQENTRYRILCCFYGTAQWEVYKDDLSREYADRLRKKLEKQGLFFYYRVEPYKITKSNEND